MTSVNSEAFAIPFADGMESSELGAFTKKKKVYEELLFVLSIILRSSDCKQAGERLIIKEDF